MPRRPEPRRPEPRRPEPRRTKIVATVGPSSRSPAVLAGMLEAGMDMARLSLAHTCIDEARERIGQIRAAADSAHRIVGVLADLPGPKVRAAPFPEGGAQLSAGRVIDLVAADRSRPGQIGIEHPGLLADLLPGDHVGLGDGTIRLVVIEAAPVTGGRARAEVVVGGFAQGRPGLNLPPGRLNQSSPTPHDLLLIDALCDAGVDAIAVSLVLSAADVERAKAAVGRGGPMVVAKIETGEAVEAAESIIAVADGVMVARGDLGIRCALEDVPHHQKHIIRTGVSFGKPVITATQMLESMVSAATPTRAEVSDVANAVFDGTSALMLSGETAIGHDPVAAVETMARVARRAEQEFDYLGWGGNLGRQLAPEAGAPAPERITAAVSAAAWRAAIDADVAAIIACTNSGATARAISRFRPTVPLLGFTPSLATARQLSVAWGVTPVVAETRASTDDIVWFAVEDAARRGVVKPGDLVAVLVGSPTDPDPTTDTLRLVRVR